MAAVTDENTDDFTLKNH